MEGKTPAESSEKEATGAQDADPSKDSSNELPPDVRAKLRRLDKLEARYHGT
jgi:hypothetical protein